MKQKTDYIFFILTGLLIASTLILSQLYGYILTINNYLAFVAWPIALFLRMKTYQGKRLSPRHYFTACTIQYHQFWNWCSFNEIWHKFFDPN